MSEEKQQADTKKDLAKLAPEMMRTILQQGVDFEVTVKTKSILNRLKILPESRKFIIYQNNLCTLFNISNVILTMTEIESLESDDLFGIGVKNVVENRSKILEIVALAIMNREISNPYLWLRKWELKRYLNRNLDAQELLRLVSLVTAQMDVTDFLASSVSIRRLNMTGTAKKGKKAKAS